MFSAEYSSCQMNMAIKKMVLFLNLFNMQFQNCIYFAVFYHVKIKTDFQIGQRYFILIKMYYIEGIPTLNSIWLKFVWPKIG